MICKTEGLVLRWYPVTDSSRIVVWWTRGYGQLSTLIKGSQRPKSWMLGQYDLFYTCELLFHAPPGRDLMLAREIYPLKRRSEFRTHWRATAAASFVSDLLFRSTHPHVASLPLYALATETLDLLARPTLSPALLTWFELRMLEHLGFHPELGESVVSRTPLHPSAKGLRFAYTEGGLLAEGERCHGPSEPISGGVLGVLRQLQAAKTAEAALRCRILPSQWQEIERHLDSFARCHLDHVSNARPLARHWMTYDLQRAYA